MFPATHVDSKFLPLVLRGVASLAVALSGLAVGCSESPGKFTQKIQRATKGTAPKPASEVSSDSSKDGSEGDKANGDEKDGEKNEDGDGESDTVEEPELQVRTVKVRTTAAKRALEKNFRGFLDREPLGFGPGLGDEFRSEGERLSEMARTLPQNVRESSPVRILRDGLPYLIVALFGALFFVLTRQLGMIAHDFQARMHFELSRWATRILRSGILVLARISTAAILVGLSYFPIRAIFGTQLWTELLTVGLWHLLAYRAISSVFVALFGGRIMQIDEENARKLKRFGVSATQFIVGFLFAITVVERLGYSEQITALLTFALRVTLVVLPAYLFFARDTVLDLLPREVDSTVYDFFRRVLSQNFRTFMAITAALLAFRAAGYVRASTFILVRGYAIIGLIVGSFAFYSLLVDFFDARAASRSADDPEGAPLEGPDPSRLAQRLEQLLGLGLIFGITALSLELLLLLEPTLILLRIPFLAIGSAEISILTLINVGLIVFGAVLATKLLRALLNAQIYPLFEVDVGVAYAINSLIKYVLVVATFFVGLAVLGVDLTAITVVVASLGVGIGFGLQTIVENLISGFIILFGQSVQKGDFITVEGTYGQVEAVGARSVVISTPDNYEMVVPSKVIVGGHIINWSYDDNLVRGRLELGVSYKSQPEEVREVLLQTCEMHEHVLDEPLPRVRLTEFGDSSVNYELLFFFDCRDTVEAKVIGELNFEIWEALEEAGIEIPFPQRDLHIKSDEDWERLTAIVDERGHPSDADPANDSADSTPETSGADTADEESA